MSIAEKIRSLCMLSVLAASEPALSAGSWPLINFPPDTKVEVIAEESWIAGALPVRIYALTGTRKRPEIFEWMAAEWLRVGHECLLDSEPFLSLDTIPVVPGKTTSVLSCVIEDHIVVGQFSGGLQASAIISMSAPRRTAQNPVSPTVRALQSYTGGKILSHEDSDFGIRQATTLTIETRGQPDFVVTSLSAALLKNNWQVERLRGLPGTGHMGRELVAVLKNERLLVSVQSIDSTHSGIVVVIEKEGGG